jgi:Cysteine rich repeat
MLMSGNLMSKLYLAAAFIAIGLSGAAYAQALSAEERAACQADFDKYCKGTTPGGGRIIACLSKNPISDACKKVVDAHKK